MVKTFSGKRLSVILVFLLAVSLLSGCGSSGGSGNNGGNNKPGAEDPSPFNPTETVTLPKKETDEFADDYEAYPTARGQTRKQSYYINLNNAGYDDIFTATVLQGIVNRENPSLYIVSKHIVSGYPAFNSTEFWLDKMRLDYPDYEFGRIETVADLVGRYRAQIGGAVLYNERFTSNSEMFVWEYAARCYGDVAVANVTQMYCAQDNAIPLTASKLSEINSSLVAAGQTPLEVLFDTTELMKADGDSILSADSRVVWKNAYEFALGKIEKGEWEVSDKALMIRNNMALADLDYSVAHKLFIFGRIKDIHSTPEERAIESKILALTKSNTPVMGCYHATPNEDLYYENGDYAGYEEHITCSYYNSIGKYWYVTYGTFNLSYTSGLPKEKAVEKSEKLTYDPSEMYVSFAFTEGDNNSYAHYRLCREYEKPMRGDFAMTWQLSQGIYDLNPNVIRYMNNRNTKYDGFAFGSSGIGYAYGDFSDKSAFYGLTQAYCERSGINCVEFFVEDYAKVTEFAEYAKGVNVFAGFEGIYEQFNGDGCARMINGNAVFRNVYNTALNPERLYTQGNLLNIKFHGWNDSLEVIDEFVKKLPENCVTVTQAQLADLLRQKQALESENITECSIKADNSITENAFVYYSDEYKAGRFDKRVLGKDEKLVYSFKLSDKVKEAEAYLHLSGDYTVMLSDRLDKWETAAKGVIAGGCVSVKIPESILGKKIYMLITAPDSECEVYGLDIITDCSAFDKAFTINPDYADAFIVSRTESETVYKIPLASGDKILSVSGGGNADIKISANGSSWYDSDSVAFAGGCYAVLSGVQFVKITATDGIDEIKITPIKTTETFAFSPCGNQPDFGACIAGWRHARDSGRNSCCMLNYGEELIYAFTLSGETEFSFLECNVSGECKIALSSDGKTYTEIEPLDDSGNTFDVSRFTRAGRRVFLKLTGSATRNSVYGVRLY